MKIVEVGTKIILHVVENLEVKILVSKKNEEILVAMMIFMVVNLVDYFKETFKVFVVIEAS